MQNRRILNAHFAEAGAEREARARDQLGVHPVCAGALGVLVERVAAWVSADAVGGERRSRSFRSRGRRAAHTVGLVIPDRDPLLPTVAALLDSVAGLDWSARRSGLAPEPASDQAVGMGVDGEPRRAARIPPG